MSDIKFHYAAGAMGSDGHGYAWHKLYDFPILPFSTKTLTIHRRMGFPFAIIKLGRSVFNKVSLHNRGLLSWLLHYHGQVRDDAIVSIYGENDDQISSMVEYINQSHRLTLHCGKTSPIIGIELNYSCPNAVRTKATIIPESILPIYIKLSHMQDPYSYDLDKVSGIRLNSIPMRFGGGSGLVAKDKNWSFIRRHIKNGIKVSGCSFNTMEDVEDLIDMGCQEISIGSVLLTNPKLVERIGKKYV